MDRVLLGGWGGHNILELDSGVESIYEETILTIADTDA